MWTLQNLSLFELLFAGPNVKINSIFQTVLKCLNVKGKVKEKKYDIVTTYVKFGPGSVLDPPHYLLHCTKSV